MNCHTIHLFCFKSKIIASFLKNSIDKTKTQCYHMLTKKLTEREARIQWTILNVQLNMSVVWQMKKPVITAFTIDNIQTNMRIER